MVMSLGVDTASAKRSAHKEDKDSGLGRRTKRTRKKWTLARQSWPGGKFPSKRHENDDKKRKKIEIG